MDGCVGDGSDTGRSAFRPKFSFGVIVGWKSGCVGVYFGNVPSPPKCIMWVNELIMAFENEEYYL